MSDPAPEQDAARALAEELFASLLAAVGEGTPFDPGFERLCAAHPELAEDLRALRSDWSLLSGVRRRNAAPPELGDERLRGLWERLTRPRPFAARFRVDDPLGSGGQGTVVEAFEHSLGRALAIKTLRADGGLDPAGEEGRLARFLAEAQITAQLDHPGIVAVHELGLDEHERPYFTMTRVRGEELTALFGRARSDAAVRWRCLGHLLRVCETLAFAHSRGVVHRDVKPSNVMIGAFGEVLVMDWGLARVVRDGEREPEQEAGDGSWIRTVRDRAGATPSRLDTEPEGRLGTLWYMAPESARRGAVDADPAVDVYAVGALLYELLAGRPPYAARLAGADLERALQHVASEPPEPVQDSPAATPELLAIVERAMAREPRERYPSMEELADDLRAFLEGRVVRAHATGPWAELRKWIRRNRRLALTIGLLSLSVVAGLVSVASLEARARRELDREADLYRLPFLEQEAGRLWPEEPATLPAYDAWLAQAERLALRAQLHRRELARVRGRARATGGGEGWAFAEDADRLRHATLSATVAGLERLARPGGLLDDVRRRRAWAAGVERRTLEEPREAWRAASERIASPGGPYAGLRFGPVLGLVPLGPDPRSGLEELAFARSGDVPRRGPDGALGLGPESALVFVLVPGGSFAMGAQSDAPDGAGFDPSARPEEGPVHVVELAPFLVAKHELTQGQWARLGGGTPSFVRADAEGDHADRHPVEGVSWNEARELLARFSLELPTEAQWEYAARAGTAGPFLGHADERGLAASVNLADATVLDAGLGWPQARGMEWLRDGYVRHAPVGSFEPNGFGLHDVLGNVWEWCLDVPAGYELPVEPGTGRRLADAPSRERVARGGGFLNNAVFARVTLRDMGRSADFDSAYHGLRPVWGGGGGPGRSE